MMPSGNLTRRALYYKSSAHHLRLDETTLSAREGIEKGEIGRQHHPRITVETQPGHRVTVNCDSIIAVGGGVVRLN